MLLVDMMIWANRKDVKRYWYPYLGCYRRYLFAMNENREIYMVTEDNFDYTDINENFPHIQEFFKGKIICSIYSMA